MKHKDLKKRVKHGAFKDKQLCAIRVISCPVMPIRWPWSRRLPLTLMLVRVQAVVPVQCLHAAGQTSRSLWLNCRTNVSHIPFVTGPPSKSEVQTDGYSQLELWTDSCRLDFLFNVHWQYRCVHSHPVSGCTHTETFRIVHQWPSILRIHAESKHL